MDKLLSIINEIRERKNNGKIEHISSELSLRNDLGFDSLDLATLTVMIEDEFEVDVFEDGIVDTIHQIENKINKGRE
ncbi:MAG: acyl carrier protein [Bacilli bacterium]|nr:acyl carrier protein [Bacilli bacterium]